MKLQFKVQDFQTDAVDSVVDCFAGQPRHEGVSYRIDPGRQTAGAQAALDLGGDPPPGFRNAESQLSPEHLLKNIQAIQRSRGLPPSTNLVFSKAAPSSPNLDIEMETGTGKTYVYIKTMLELRQRYGWSKFIVVVPSIAIREGVQKSFDITADHFQKLYGTKPRSFIYNSSRLHELESFSSDPGIQVMIINIQAFNSRSKDNRRIYDELDDFQSRRPIDVISANRPIVIIDEPQKIGADASQESLSRFNPLMVLRYSATHRDVHNRVHRLDAVDAYNQKLVKRIAVRGITVKGLAGTSAYLYLDSIEVAKGARPRARIELEVRSPAGAIQRQVKRVDAGTRLHDLSGGLEAYRELVVTDIDANRDVMELSSGDVVAAGQLANDDVTEETKRRIQIREVVRAHLDKERELFSQGVKVLSLFFIDEVAKYRDYSRADTLGDYARIFEEEYRSAVKDLLDQLPLGESAEEYRDYLQRDDVSAIHEGYFSIDRKSDHLVDPAVAATGADKGLARDVDAYDLILKNKEKLLSLEEPVRFIFSHSALREGWDNPNVFVMGMLKKSDNTISRRQEIGRGLRLAVNQDGERMDNPVTVHDINELTVVTDESYTDFVAGLQKEIFESLSGRPQKATPEFFTGKRLEKSDGSGIREISKSEAELIWSWLLINEFIDDQHHLTDKWLQRANIDMPALPGGLDEFHYQIDGIVDSLHLDIPQPTDGRKPKRIPLNEANFTKREFQSLWGRINHKAVYQVDFDSAELISRCIRSLDRTLKVAPLQYVIESGQQSATLETEDLESGSGFATGSTHTHTETTTASSQVTYDLLGEIAEKTQLTRRTIAAVLQGIDSGTFAKYRQNPEQFITQAARLINEQKASVIVEHLTYDTLNDHYDTAIFTENQTKQDFTNATSKLKKHIYDYVVADSGVEREFIEQLEAGTEVVVYAKLPRGFLIPTPVGDYNPDWAIAFDEGAVKHVYFVAETKGSLSSLKLRGVESAKIECARRFFAELAAENQDVKYDVVTDYSELLALVSG